MSNENITYIFHVGMPKCASTLLQHVMHQLERLLYTKYSTGLLNQDIASNSIDFTMPKLVEENIRIAKVMGSRIVGPNVESYFERMIQAPAIMSILGFYICYAKMAGIGEDQENIILQELSDKLRSCVNKHSLRNILISSEYLCNPRISTKAVQKLSQDGQTKIICVIRRQDKFLFSLYCNVVRYHAVPDQYIDWLNSKDLDHLLGGVRSLIAWDQTLDLFSEKFGEDNVHLMFFEDIFKSDIGFINDFIHLFNKDLNIDFKGAIPQLNPSMNENGMDILRYVNSVLNPSSKERLQTYKFLEQVFSQKTGEKAEDKLSIDERRNLLMPYLDGNRYVIEKYAPMRLNDNDLVGYYTNP